MKPREPQTRLLYLIRQGKDLTISEMVERALLSAPSTKKLADKHSSVIEWSFNGQRFRSAGAATAARYRHALDIATQDCPGGLPALIEWGGFRMPELMRKMAEARLRKLQGTPRKKGWKWDKASRARLAASRAGAKDSGPRKRGYPLFTLTPGFTLPETGSRFTITRETLAGIRAMIFPEGL